MELRVFFDEAIIRKLYEKHFTEKQNKVISRVKAVNNITLGITSVTILSFIMEHLVFGGAFTVIGFIYSFKNWLENKKDLNKINRERDDSEKHIEEEAKFKDIRYVYDDLEIALYKDFKLDDKVLWKEMTEVQKDSDFLYILFRNSVIEYIWIPFAIVNNAELIIFEKFVKQKAEDLKVEFWNN